VPTFRSVDLDLAADMAFDDGFDTDSPSMRGRRRGS